MIQDLLEAIYECGTIMNESELRELAYHYGHTVFIEDDNGNVIDREFLPDYQAVADIYTDGFDCSNY